MCTERIERTARHVSPPHVVGGASAVSTSDIFRLITRNRPCLFSSFGDTVGFYGVFL